MTAGVAPVYLGAVRVLSRRLRVDPVTLDRAIAAVLTVVAQIEIWFSSEVHHHRLWGALVVPFFTMPVAVRRRYPALVGTGVAVIAALQHGFGHDPQIIAEPIGYFCALYALAVWTPTPRFVGGVAVLVAADLATARSEEHTSELQ